MIIYEFFVDFRVDFLKDDIDFNCSFNDYFFLKDKEIFMVSNVYYFNLK